MDALTLIKAVLDSWNLDKEYYAWLMDRIHPDAIIHYVEDHAKQFDVWIDYEWFDRYLDKYILNYILVYDSSYMKLQSIPKNCLTKT